MSSYFTRRSFMQSAASFGTGGCGAQDARPHRARDLKRKCDRQSDQVCRRLYWHRRSRAYLSRSHRTVWHGAA